MNIAIKSMKIYLIINACTPCKYCIGIEIKYNPSVHSDPLDALLH